MTVPPVILAALSACRPLRDFSEVQPGDHIYDDLELDDLDRITAAMFLEEELHIELPDHVIERWQFISDMIAAVRTAPVPA